MRWRYSKNSSLSGLTWLYFLAAIPVVTDLIEVGHLPATSREWTTEIIVGALIAILVRRAQKEHESAIAMARTDALTGLMNRRAFEATVSEEFRRAHESSEVLCLVYLDLDNFRLVNNLGGHEAGDRALQQFAEVLRHTLGRTADRAFRIGGDEFALLLRMTADEANVLVSTIEQDCKTTDVVWSRGPLRISAGVVELTSESTAEEFIRSADRAMYRHKFSRVIRNDRDVRKQLRHTLP